jgi:hypothetical protein
MLATDFAAYGTIRCQALQHLGKARALIDGIGTAHGCVVVFANDGESCLFGERLYGSSLSFIAVLVSTHTGRAGGAKIGHCWLASVSHFKFGDAQAVPCSRRQSPCRRLRLLARLIHLDGVLTQLVKYFSID